MQDEARKQQDDVLGVLDTATTEELVGWAAFRGTSHSVSVRVMVDGEEAGVTDCRLYRSGVIKRGLHATGYCGFRFQMPVGLSPGQQVRVFESATGTELRGSPTVLEGPGGDAEGGHCQKKLFFMHIAKAAGSSLNRFIQSQYPRRRSRTHIETSDFRSDSTFSARYDYLSGHVRLHEARRRMNIDDFLWITLLRDPYSHLASHLAWVRYIGEEPESDFFLNHPLTIRQLAQELAAVDFADTAALVALIGGDNPVTLNLFDNCQTRYLLPGHRVERLTIDDARLALDMLKRFDLVGLVEQYDDFVSRLCSLMDWKLPPGTERVNVQPKRYGLDVNNPAVRQALHPFVQCDLVLYDSVQSGGC